MYNVIAFVLFLHRCYTNNLYLAMKSLTFIFIAVFFSVFIQPSFCALFAQTDKNKNDFINMNNLLKSDTVKFNYGNTKILIDLDAPYGKDTTDRRSERSGAGKANSAIAVDTAALKKDIEEKLNRSAKSKPTKNDDNGDDRSNKGNGNPPAKPAQVITPAIPTKVTPAATVNTASPAPKQVVPQQPPSTLPAAAKTPPQTNSKPTTTLPATTYTYVVKTPENIIPQKKLITPPPIHYPKGASGNDAATYKARLSALPTVIAMDYNDIVAGFIKMYLTDKRDQVSRMLSRADNYMTVFEAALDRHNLPMELAYLPVIESALVPHAKNDKGASGLWQLPYGIAKQYGLDANNYIDERRDPLLSSEVAAQYINYLYKKYSDWHLVIAAYNSGEGAINKAIQQAGGRQNYWEISTFLPVEAQAYVPLFIAAVYVMNYYPEHGLNKYDAPYQYSITDTIRVKNGLNLKNFALNVSMEYDQLVFLNPAIIRDTVPPSKRGYPIVLPLSKLGIAEAYIHNLDPNADIYIDRTKEKSVKIPENSLWNEELDVYGYPVGAYKSKSAADAQNNAATATKDAPLDYYVQNGDVLLAIAQKFDCTDEELKKWNNLKTADKLIPFQKLRIWVAANDNKFALYENIALQSTPLDEKTIQNANKKIREHIIKQGETLWKIAEKYKVDAEQLKKYNGLKSNTLKPGTTLKIPQ